MEHQEAFCRHIWNWSKGRAGEWSTWRGAALVGAAVITAINPVAGAAVAKVVAAGIGSYEIIRKETRE